MDQDLAACWSHWILHEVTVSPDCGARRHSWIQLGRPEHVDGVFSVLWEEVPAVIGEGWVCNVPCSDEVGLDVLDSSLRW